MATPASPRSRPDNWSNGARYNEEGYRRDGRKQVQGFRPIRSGGLNQFYANQNRSLPTGYNPYNTIDSTAEISARANDDTGRDIGPGGGWVPQTGFATQAMQQGGMLPQQAPTPSTPASTWFDRVMNGGFTTQSPATGAVVPDAPPMAGVGQPGFGPNPNDTRSSINLSSFADRIRQARENQMAQEQNQFRSQFSIGPDPTSAGDLRMNLNSPYGTGSSTTAPRTGPATYGPGGAPMSQFFQNAADRQGIANRFATPTRKPASPSFLSAYPQVNRARVAETL